jgi:hypothetical protein
MKYTIIVLMAATAILAVGLVVVPIQSAALKLWQNEVYILELWMLNLGV